jgi:hypothetical protein
MSNLILAKDGDLSALQRPFEQAAALDKAAEKLKQRVRWADLNGVLQRVLNPVFGRIAQLTTLFAGMGASLTETDISVAAMNELLIEKGIYTAEEFNAKEADMTKRYTEATSPAQEGAEAAAHGQTTERLVEPMGATTEAERCVPSAACRCTTPCGETHRAAESEVAPRRLVEG